MTNPSTIWSQLSTPLSSNGSCPFVTTDGVTISADVTRYYYTDNTWGTLTGSQLFYQLTVANGIRVNYADTTATPGAVTLNRSVGRIKIAAAGTSVVITNSNCFATSVIHLQMETNDTTMTRVIPVPANGSFTITGNAAATAAVTITFTITNVY